MTHDDIRTKMADYLDELLEEHEAREVEALIAAHPALLADVARMRAILYRPYAVPPPRADAAERVVARTDARPLRKLVRYAAVFAAGVLLTMFLRDVRPVTPGIEQPDEIEPPQAVAVEIQNLRIR